MLGLPLAIVARYQPIRRIDGTQSKCSSRDKIARSNWRQCAAIQSSFAGIGFPDRFSAARKTA